MLLAISFVSMLALVGNVSAHPGELEEHGTPARREFLGYAQRSIAGCKDQLVARGHQQRAIARRAALAENLRTKRGLPVKRDLADDLSTSHKSNATGLTANSTGTEIFTGDLNCVLQAEVTVGPYYVSGELVRSNMVETQVGVPFYADFQLIDVTTCEPISGIYVDAWHANSSGVYAGVVAQGNGNTEDTANINTTFARGITQTDSDGVAYFETLVPGHYTGRANHIHILATINASVLANNTLSGGNVSHVGQVFFDQDLLTTVEATSPYSLNTQEQTQNANDSILSEEAASMDPFFNYVLLGSDVSEGVLGWISIGIDPSKEYNVSSAATWTEDGGVANANANAGGGPGGSPPDGSTPNSNGTNTTTSASGSGSTSSTAAASIESSSATQSSISLLLGLFAFVWAL